MQVVVLAQVGITGCAGVRDLHGLTRRDAQFRRRWRCTFLLSLRESNEVRLFAPQNILLGALLVCLGAIMMLSFPLMMLSRVVSS